EGVVLRHRLSIVFFFFFVRPFNSLFFSWFPRAVGLGLWSARAADVRQTGRPRRGCPRTRLAYPLAYVGERVSGRVVFSVGQGLESQQHPTPLITSLLGPRMALRLAGRDQGWGNS
ncbi:unnamed protein product, partial [Discosporangium mesarthrocarpum]